jgi:hypothetical protein
VALANAPPQLPGQRAILNCLAQVIHRDARARSDIRDGAGQLQHAIMRACLSSSLAASSRAQNFFNSRVPMHALHEIYFPAKRC